MRRKIAAVICMCMLGAAFSVSGCSKEKEAEVQKEEKEAEEKKEEKAELKGIGAEKDSDFQIELKNNTGKDITGVSIKLIEETEYPANMLETGDVYKKEESRKLYYKIPEDTADSDGDDSDEKVLTPGYDIELTFEDDSTAE